VLSTLPTHLEIKGLPFNVGFEYSLYTLTYVLLQGYGEIATDTGSQAAASAGAAHSGACTAARHHQPGKPGAPCFVPSEGCPEGALGFSSKDSISIRAVNAVV